MGLFRNNPPPEPTKPATMSTGMSLPKDTGFFKTAPEQCHCLSDMELERRYNVQRAEEHARCDGRCGQLWTRESGQAKSNAQRNRYKNIIPWDHSRVKLPVSDASLHNDYINASWIQIGSNTYIATQGPLGTTMSHFWQMTYAYGGDPAVIVMLTPLYEHAVEKCTKYWPDKDNDLVFPGEKDGFDFGLRISLEKFSDNDHYNYSALKITPDDPRYPPHLVHHVYYHSWLDYSKPNADADLRALIHLVNNKLKNPGAPPIVHCSAGIGRTGTFIAIDALLSKVDGEIELSNLPNTSPVWLNSTNEYLYKSTPFTGDPSEHQPGVSASPANPLSKITSRLEAEGFAQSWTSASSVAGSRGRRPSMLQPARHTETSEIMDHALTSPLSESNTAQPSPTESNRNSTIENGELLAFPKAVSSNDTAANGTNGTANGTTEPESKLSQLIGKANTTPPTANPNETPAKVRKSSSALRGPELVKRPSEVELESKILEERPEDLNVLGWFEVADPVMSVLRCMRKQRPKMVQGTQQLGYIYDQLELVTQLAKVQTKIPGSQRRQDSNIAASCPSDLHGVRRSHTALGSDTAFEQDQEEQPRHLFRRSTITSIFHRKDRRSSHSSTVARSPRA